MLASRRTRSSDDNCVACRSGTVTRFEVAGFCQLIVKLSFALSQSRRYDNLDFQIIVAASAAALRQTMLFEAHSLTGLRTGGDADADFTGNRRNFEARAKRRFPGGEQQIGKDVIAGYSKVRVGL